MGKTLLHLIEDNEEVFSRARSGEMRMEIAGRSVSIRRMQCYAVKGVACVRCGIQGTEIRLEEWSNGGGIHLDFYGYNQNGHRVMMTIDHIVPKSKGGPNELSNYQPMCEPCNSKKGANLEPKITELISTETQLIPLQ